MTTLSKASTAAGTRAEAKPLPEAMPHDRDASDRLDPHPPVPADPAGVEIEIPVIATRLSRMPRWCGGGVHACSVAEHSVLVTKIMEKAVIDENGDPENPFIARALLFGLLHDAHEAFTGDMTRQVQDWYAAELPGFTAARERLNGAWDRVIFAAVGIGEPEAPADEMAARIERGVLFDGEAGDGVVHGWSPEQAYAAFMRLYVQLRGRLQADPKKGGAQ